jgi:hypothetical protein
MDVYDVRDGARRRIAIEITIEIRGIEIRG